MSTVESSIVIAASPERVWDVVMDAHRFGEWVTIHRGLRNVSPDPVREGSEMEQTLHLRGADIRVHWLLVECQAPNYARWQGRGPARTRARIEYRLTAVSEGTRFDYQNEFETPFGALGAFASRRVMGHMAQREADRSLDALRELLERGGG
ncbi:MAG TPA: SRPBCC family protein [Solirubrobacteraceae bacterium]|nr:SRPBCC family protein [Solirubrobacteraceae bacterium]